MPIERDRRSDESNGFRQTRFADQKYACSLPRRKLLYRSCIYPQNGRIANRPDDNLTRPSLLDSRDGRVFLLAGQNTTRCWLRDPTMKNVIFAAALLLLTARVGQAGVYEFKSYSLANFGSPFIYGRPRRMTWRPRSRWLC